MQQVMSLLHCLLAMRDAHFLIQIADISFDGGGGDIQLGRDLVVTVVGINHCQHPALPMRQRAGSNQFGYLRMTLQATDKGFIEMGKLVAMVLIKVA